jgi:hypothetical protein
MPWPCSSVLPTSHCICPMCRYRYCCPGTLVSHAGSQCSFSPTYQYSILHMAQPKWLDSFEPLQWLHLNVNMTLTSGVAGVVMHLLDADNYYAVLVDQGSAVVSLVAVVVGVTTTLSSMPLTGSGVAVLSSAGVNVDVVMQASGINVTIPALGVTLTSPDTTFKSGTFGFISDGVASFGQVMAETECDGGGVQCASPTTGVTCTFRCGVGYFVALGDEQRTCTYGRWSGGDLTCAIRTFLGAARLSHGTWRWNLARL